MRILPRLLLAFTLLVSFSNLGLLAATFNIVASADSYFETYGSEKKNFGSQPVLRMDQWGGRQIFMRFDLSPLPRQQHLLSAKLKLYIVEVGFNEQGEFPDLRTCVGLYDVATPWTELGLTYDSPDGQQPWNQGPGIAEPKYKDVGPLPKPDIGVYCNVRAIPLNPRQSTNGTWLELDVSDFIRQRLNAGEPEVNLLLRSSILGRNYTFRSREAEQVVQRPRLTVECDDAIPAFNVHDVLTTAWKPGLQVPVPIEGGKLLTDAGVKTACSLEQAPVSTSANPPVLTQTPIGASLTPNVPGKYRVRVAVQQRPSLDGSAAKGERSASRVANVYVLSVPAHPRLYVTPQSLQRLRQDVSSGSRLTKAFLDWVRAGSRGLPSGKFHDMAIHEGCENNALAWLLTSDGQFLSNSIAYAQLVLRKPMREHFDDVHSATFLGASWVHAVALHYDWCYGQLSSEHRHAVIAWLKEAANWGWARSGAPIAHNDGGARQCLLASAALALLGDDPEAEELYRRSHENFETNLLPWLNDGGRGGRSGDGGEYEGLHSFYLVKYAWMAQTATGEDVFSAFPFFSNRMNHILFGWYPRRLVERTGAFSMRQYYSPSGDHTRLGYVGDTQPYQSAAALCARFRDTPQAQALRWLGGDWPTQWMQYTLRWAVLGEWEHIPASAPSASAAASGDPKPDRQVKLAYLDPGCNTAYIRSDWGDDATWVLFENAPFVSAHDSLDSGTFEIFKGDLLAARTGNLDFANVGAPHTMNYLHRTIAGNCLLIEDPKEKWKGFLGGAEGGPDGGGERTNFPLTSSPDADTYRIYRDIFQRGRITHFRQEDAFAYGMADLTTAYNNPTFHGGNLNEAKVKSVTRQLLYLRGLDTLLVFDRIASLKAEFKKTFLLHSLGELDVLDGIGSPIDDGEFQYQGATRAVLRYGWPKPVPSFARCLSVTLLPDQAVITKIGGRTELPPGKTEGFPADKWHGQHQHHHVKDFWVCGTNYPPGEPPEVRWFGSPTAADFIPGTPDETGGRGKWRLEVSPPIPALTNVFFHALCPRLGREGPFPTISKLRSNPAMAAVPAAGQFEGTLVRQGDQQAAVFFSADEKPQSAFWTHLPATPRSLLLVTGLTPGYYLITMTGHAPQKMSLAGDGLVMISDAAGELRIIKQ